MAHLWQHCPDCKAYYEVRPGSELATACPTCGKAAIASVDSVAKTYDSDKLAFDSRHDVLSEAQVVPDAANCVQCGMCSYNCPMEIDVRAHAWRGKAIRDSHCLTCSECVNRCPRGVLRFERIPLFVFK